MALSTICMLATAIIPIGSFALPAIAGVILIPINLELGKKWAVAVFLGVSLLSVFLSPDHTAIISFIVFLGYYPILKEVIEKIRKPVLEWVLKLVTFNLAIAVGVCITILFFTLDYLISEYAVFGVYGIPILILVVNITFVIYDIGLTRLIGIMAARLMPLFKKLK